MRPIRSCRAPKAWGDDIQAALAALAEAEAEKS